MCGLPFLLQSKSNKLLHGAWLFSSAVLIDMPWFFGVSIY